MNEKLEVNKGKTPLQRLLLPGLFFGASEEMYVRCENEHVQVLLSNNKIIIRPGGRVIFDTYFNALTVSFWKKNCDIKSLSLVLFGAGKYIVRFGLHRIGHSTRWLYESTVRLNGELDIELPFWTQLEDGMLYVELTALTDGEILGGYFGTDTIPVRDVKLGIVITHFNRKSQVLPAISRIKSQLLDDPLCKESIELVVVDNSCTISTSEADGATLIRNRNLGGSGGFTRGLLSLIDDGRFTHCLFMDDDASCEVESIRRTYAFLRFSLLDKIAVAGSLLREIEPFRLFEKGAQFDGLCRPLKNGLDMRNVGDLLWAEVADKRPHYGGWWFFAFSISDVKHFPYPFFVRGDDIMFGLMHDFNIVTCNGINCWGEDFGLKSGPLPIYLDARNHVLQNILQLGGGLLSSLSIMTKFFFSALLSYNYSTARAVTLAMRHVSEGPEFWLKNIDMATVRGEILGFLPNEKMQPIRRSDYLVSYRGGEEGWIRKIIRYVTFNGFLLPYFFIRKSVVFQHKSFRANFREIFRYERVLYEYEPQGVGYLAFYDRKRFLVEVLRFLSVAVAFSFGFSAFRRRYKAALPVMTSQGFWRDIYSKTVDGK